MISKLTKQFLNQMIDYLPLSYYIFDLDEPAKYKDIYGNIITTPEYEGIGVKDIYGDNHLYVFYLGELESKESILRAIEIKKLRKDGRLASNQPKTKYDFYVLDPLENQKKAVEQLIYKCIVGVNHSTLTKGYDDKLQLRPQGNIHIGYDQNKVMFQIDGMYYKSEELIHLVETYEGYHLEYVIRDGTSFLQQDQILVPMVINEKTLGEELKHIIYALSKDHQNQFIESSNVEAFDLLFESILYKLKVYEQDHYYISNDVGKHLIQILKKLKSDHESFPNKEIEEIQKMIDE